jgi:dihydroorotate dehydrogenase
MASTSWSGTIRAIGDRERMLIENGAGLLRKLPPEAAHRATLALVGLSAPFLGRACPDDPRLALNALDLHFPNPVGLAAGFDKDARVPDAMLNQGFGFVECGTVTPLPQPGNPRPRLFRLESDLAVINRMGFNNAGARRVARRLAARTHRGILGINIGTNKDSVDRIADYRAAFDMLAPFADYVTINVSSPNTPGLRALQGREELARLLGLLVSERVSRNLRTPLLLKISPDLELQELDVITDVALASGIDGLIVSNTTVARPDYLTSAYAAEAGGLSGVPLFDRSTQLLRETRARVAKRLTLIGVGGISSGATAYAKIRAGATLLQIYTALALQGPGLIGRIKKELLTLLSADGFSNIMEAIGSDISA